MEAQDAGPVWWVKCVAVLSLIGGLIGAIALWSNADQTVVSDDYFGTFDEETNPFIVMMGFVSLLQGVLVWAVLMVYASMGQNVAVLAANSGSARRTVQEPTTP